MEGPGEERRGARGREVHGKRARRQMGLNGDSLSGMPDDAGFFKEKTIATVNGGGFVGPENQSWVEFQEKSLQNKPSVLPSYPLNNNAAERAVFTHGATIDL